MPCFCHPSPISGPVDERHGENCCFGDRKGGHGGASWGTIAPVTSQHINRQKARLAKPLTRVHHEPTKGFNKGMA